MLQRDAYELNRLTKRFYALFGASFSATRQAPWEGWARVARLLAAEFNPGEGAANLPARCKLADLGCGNCRFERFLVEEIPVVAWDFYLSDCTDDLPETAGLPVGLYKNIDVTGFMLAPLAGWRVLEGEQPLPLPILMPAGESADAAVSFGLMHHVPSDTLRIGVLRTLLREVRRGGLVAVSFWQFLEDERPAAKADKATEAALTYLRETRGNAPQLDAGDRLLGWQDATPAEGAIRYCHSFTDEEITALIDAVSDQAELADCFVGEGSDRLNTYVVLRRREIDDVSGFSPRPPAPGRSGSEGLLYG